MYYWYAAFSFFTHLYNIQDLILPDNILINHLPLQRTAMSVIAGDGHLTVHPYMFLFPSVLHLLSEWWLTALMEKQPTDSFFFIFLSETLLSVNLVQTESLAALFFFFFPNCSSRCSSLNPYSSKKGQVRNQVRYVVLGNLNILYLCPLHVQLEGRKVALCRSHNTLSDFKGTFVYLMHSLHHIQRKIICIV